MTLVSLIYVSVESEDFDRDDIVSILEKSRKNNQELNLTGMLLYRSPYFIQVLEGDEIAVDGIFEKIKKDDRHSSVLTVTKEYIQERSFTDWAMGFKNLEDIDPDSLDGYSDFLTNSAEPDFFISEPTRAKFLLQSFKEERWW